ncbi:NAD(P)H-dependent oxidoreductase [Mesorhizobium sp. CAU 1732]|uniref:NAD(P)H-dependent oxidoreductase n=1 Tax=Mesorhizobium sp. CAU 1732 TaxID=3140358 RepID=UPI003261A153
MKALIVHAHPEPQSFTTSMKDTARRVLEAQGYDTVVSDLYAQQFNPVASASDFGSRKRDDYLVYALEQRNGFETSSLAPDIAEEVDKLLAADLLVLNFPFYWFSMPAILKGWIDRVFLSGPLYGGVRFYDKGGLRGRKAFVTATLGGRPHMFGPKAIHGEINDMLRHLLRGTLGYVGYDVLEPFYAYHVPYLPEDERRKIMDDFETALRGLDTRPALSFPSLDNFDGELFPLDHLAVAK